MTSKNNYRKLSHRKPSRRKQFGGDDNDCDIIGDDKANKIYMSAIKDSDNKILNKDTLVMTGIEDAFSIIQYAPNLFRINGSWRNIFGKLEYMTFIKPHDCVIALGMPADEIINWRHKYNNAVYYCNDRLTSDASETDITKMYRELKKPGMDLRIERDSIKATNENKEQIRDIETRIDQIDSQIHSQIREITINRNDKKKWYSGEISRDYCVSGKDVKINYDNKEREVYIIYSPYSEHREILYSGKFKNYKKTGCGFNKFKDNCSYKGAFKDDNIFGKGEYTINGVPYKIQNSEYNKSFPISNDTYFGKGEYVGDMSKSIPRKKYKLGLEINIYNNNKVVYIEQENGKPAPVLIDTLSIESNRYTFIKGDIIIKINDMTIPHQIPDDKRDEIINKIKLELNGELNSDIIITVMRGDQNEIHTFKLRRIDLDTNETADNDELTRFGYGKTTYQIMDDNPYYKNELTYEGYYVNNKRHGPGTFTFRSHSLQFKCIWNDDEPEQQCKDTFDKIKELYSKYVISKFPANDPNGESQLPPIINDDRNQ